MGIYFDILSRIDKPKRSRETTPCISGLPWISTLNNRGDALDNLRLLVYNFFWVGWDMEHDDEWEPWKITYVRSESLTPKQVGLEKMIRVAQPPLMYQRLPYVEIRDDIVMVRRLTHVKDDVYDKFQNKIEIWARNYPAFVKKLS